MWLRVFASIVVLFIIYRLLDRYVRTVPLVEPWYQTADGRIEDAFLRCNNPDELGALTAEILKQWTQHDYEAVIVSAQNVDGRPQFLAIEFMGPSKIRFTGKPLVEVMFAPPTRQHSQATAFLRSCDKVKNIECSIVIFTKLGRHMGAFVEGLMPRDAVTGMPCISGYLAPSGSIWRDKLMTFLVKRSV